MPQVHNPSRLMDMESSAFAKNSRYMAAINFTEGSLRRMNALNFLDKRLTSIKVKYYTRQERIQNGKMERTRNRMIENLQKRLAYKLVLKSHSISTAKDYHSALKDNYSFESMQHEVKNMMYMMRPEHVREKRARVLINEQQRRYDEAIKKNRENLDRLFPPPKKWEPPSFNTADKKRENYEGEKSEADNVSPLPNIERRNRQSLHTLRRRIITLDDPKPEIKSPSLIKQPLSPIKTPVIIKQPSSHSLGSARRQTITMNMMKKQKSFLETKEKTNLTEKITEENKENTVNNLIEEQNNEADTPERQGNDLNHIDQKDTNRYKLLPPIDKAQNDVPEVNRVKTNKSENVGKLPVLKMKKGHSGEEM